MRESFWNRKIPTLLALTIVVCGILATSYLVNKGVIYLGGAAPSDNPLDVRVTNITERSLSVTYRTETQVIGTISIGQDKNTLQTILDERDQQSGIPKPYTLHSITVKNLQPNTQYVFSITSGATTYVNNNSLFQVKTGPQITTNPSSQTPVTGKIITADGQAPKEAFVFFTATGGQTLSVLTNASGIYIIPINTYRTSDLASYVDWSKTNTLQILATDGTSSSQARVSLSGTNPVPIMTLASNYDFTTSTQPVATSSGQTSGFPAFSLNNQYAATPVITTPKKDETFSDSQPQFSGQAQPNQTVTIEIHSSDVVNGTVTTNAQGRWVFRPSQPLSPGKHTISITTKDASGILKTIEQSFTVYASGTQLDQSVTPSPSASPMPTPTITVVPTTTAVTPTVVPTTAPSVTVIPTPKVTLSPTPVTKLPPTGSNSLMVAGLTGIATTAVGIVLFLLTRGATTL